MMEPEIAYDVLVLILFSIAFGYFFGNVFPIIKSKQEKNNEIERQEEDLVNNKASKNREEIVDTDGFQNKITKESPKASINIFERLKCIFQKIWNYSEEVEEKKLPKSGNNLEKSFGDDLNNIDMPSQKISEVESVKSKALVRLTYDPVFHKILIMSGEESINLNDLKNDELVATITSLIIDLQEQIDDKFESHEDHNLNFGKNDFSISSLKPLDLLIKKKPDELISKDEDSGSIPKQINNILQKELSGTDLDSLRISVKENPVKNVVFNVGIDVYDEIDLVPDPEIQKAIRNAVATWEKQQGNG